MAQFVSSPETFVVEEAPAYLPCGQGHHTFVWVEKRGLTTPELVKRLGRLLGVPDRDVGYAGMKDRHATTRQWLSLPGVDPAVALSVQEDGFRVLEAKKHGNKLRTGHLDGNRFEVVLTSVTDIEAVALAAGLAALQKSGLPNRYGDQRFGAGRDNVEVGIGILRGVRRERDFRRSRLLLSAVQSAVFNRVLDARQAGGGLLRVRTGDVLQKVASGGMFICDDKDREQARVDAGEIVPTGPMPGFREMKPPPGSEAAALEQQALADLGLSVEDFARQGRDLPGSRRPVVVPVVLGDPAIETQPGVMRLRFSLPAGTYATVLLAELGALLPPEAVLNFASAPPRNPS